MEILHIIRSVNPDGGGPIEGIHQLSAEAKADGHNVEIASLDGPNEVFLARSTLKVHALGPGLGKYGYSKAFIPWLLANGSAYDAIIVNGIWQYHSYGAWKALKKIRKPYHLYTHGMLDPWFKERYPLKHLKKLLYWPWAEYNVVKDAQAVLFTCEEERNLARKSFSLYKCNEIVVRYGTAGPSGDLEGRRQAFYEKFPQLRNKRTILFVGRIHPKKGCDILLRAFSRVLQGQADWQLAIVGPDQVDLKKTLCNLAEQLGIADQVLWTGALMGDLKWGAFAAAEIFMLPSHQENFGIVVAEAMACGVPPLISSKVNIWNEIVAAGAGLVSSDDVAGTTDILNTWTKMSASERQLMSCKAKACFLQHFEVRRAATELWRILEQSRG